MRPSHECVSVTWIQDTFGVAQKVGQLHFISKSETEVD